MKKYIILLIVSILPFYLEAQNVCYIKYSYDASGNRIQREFFCGSPDEDDGSIGWNEHPGGDDPVSRPANITTDQEVVNQEDFDFIVSPNPSDGRYQVQLMNESLVGSTLQILDARGSNVLDKKLENMNFWIDISRYSNGTYYFYIRKEQQTKAKKVLKK